MNNIDAETLCAFEEAAGEPDDGVAAIVRVIRNRMALRYASDGTAAGTVFRHDQFSWTSWAMRNGHYTEVAKTPEEVTARAQDLLQRDEAMRSAWARVADIGARVRAGTYSGADYDRLTDDVVLYLNPRLSRAVWATPDKHVCDIGRHSFYRA